MTTPAGTTAPIEPPVDAQRPFLASLSPSRASDFMTCPLLYRYRVVDRIPERPSRAAARGTLVHAVLEQLFDLPAAQRTQSAATERLAATWETLLADEPELTDLFTADAAVLTQAADTTPPADTAKAAGTTGGVEAVVPPLTGFLREAERLLARYFTLEDPARLEPAEREVRVETVLGSGLTLRGIIDRVDVAPSGEIRVVDYKTGRAPSEVFEAKALFQMKFYALVLWRIRGVVPTLLQLVYLGGEGELIRYAPDERDLLATERKLTALWAAIERAHRTGDWRPSPSRLCSWCDHQAICPAFGGTPPPLPVPPPSGPAAAGSIAVSDSAA